MGNNKAKQPAEPLNEEEIKTYCQMTGFTDQVVLSYYESFIADCPSGKLSKKQFQTMYRQLYPYSRSDKFCGRIFTIFDCNKDNYLDFGEFLRAIRITMRGDINEKLKCAFEIYDLKGDGKIDKREMKKTLNSIYDMLGEDNRRYRRNSKFAEKKVELIFQKYDTDKDNKLSLDEFINGCLNDEYLNQLLKSNFIMSN